MQTETLILDQDQKSDPLKSLLEHLPESKQNERKEVLTYLTEKPLLSAFYGSLAYDCQS